MRKNLLKSILVTAALAFGVTGTSWAADEDVVSAEPRFWNFSSLAEADEALLKAEVENGTWTESKGRYQNTNAAFDNEVIAIEGTELETTKGLIFTAPAGKLLLGSPSGSNKFMQVQNGAYFVVTGLTAGDTLRAVVQSASKDAITLTALDEELAKVVEGFEPTKDKATCTIVMLKDGDVTLKSTAKDIRFFTLEAIPADLVEETAGLTIAEFKALEDGTEATLAVKDTKVTFVAGGNAYIEDETGALLLEATGLTLTAGKAITGTINGKFTVEKGLAKLVATEATAASEFTEADTEIAATVITVADAEKAEYVSRLVKFENVDANLDYQEIMQGDDYIGFIDKYNVLDGVCPKKIESIVGVIGTISGINLFYPVSPDSIVVAAVAPATEVKTIAEMKAVEPGTEVNFVMDDVKVTYLGYSWNGNFATLEDATGAVRLGAEMIGSMFIEQGISAGMAVTGHVRGTYTVVGGVPTFDISENTGAEDELTATEATVEPTEVTIAEVKNAESVSKYVILKDVKMTATVEGWYTYYTAAQGEETIAVDDQFMDPMTYDGILSKYMDEETGDVVLPAEFKSVTAIVGVDETGAYVLYPTAVVEKDINTGISGVGSDVNASINDVHTVNGVKVRAAGESIDGLAKGLYIIGGKKVVIK